MKISLVNEMRQIDKFAQEKFGVPELVLMENAGRASSDVMIRLLGGSAAGKTVCVLAGGGNNGGDAFAAARHLMNNGAEVKIFFAGNSAKLTKSAAINRDICSKMGMSIQPLATGRDFEKLPLFLNLSDGVLDGLLGTGVKGDLRDPMPRIIKCVNDAHRPVVSIDVPSGVNADTGAVASEAVMATATVTFGLLKAGLFFSPGASHAGEIVVDTIGLPVQLLYDRGIMQEYLDDGLAASLLPKRAIDVHKGSCGRVLAIAGSRGMTGAAVLASRAIMRSGAGLEMLASAESLLPIYAEKLTETMTQPLPEVRPGVLGDSAYDVLMKQLAKFDVVLIGPGLGRASETTAFVRRLANEVHLPLVLDADGLFAFVGHTMDLKGIGAPLIMTPHLGEMAALLGMKVEALKANIIEISRKAAHDWGAILVVKSECTIVVFPDGRVYITSKGNPSMATAGSGDVLAGTIAGLIGQMEKGHAGDAALLGVYLHGAAGDLADEEKGEGLVAGDIVRCLPTVRKNLKKLA
ncbi:MAG: NAD(P)H-hydrate dehydratase [Selenomonadaceae bacterium]